MDQVSLEGNRHYEGKILHMQIDEYTEKSSGIKYLHNRMHEQSIASARMQ